MRRFNRASRSAKHMIVPARREWIQVGGLGSAPLAAAIVLVESLGNRVAGLVILAGAATVTASTAGAEFVGPVRDDVAASQRTRSERGRRTARYFSGGHPVAVVKAAQSHARTRGLREVG